MRERKIKQAFVSITKNESEQKSLTEALDLLPVKDIIRGGEVVVITPNWVNEKPPETGTVVGPYTLQELIKYVKRFNPKEIIVATGSGGKETGTIFKNIGYDKIIEAEQVQFIDLNYGPYTELELEHSIVTKTKINTLIERMDVLISFSQLKQHEEATVTASVKNIALGWPPAEIHGFPKKNLGIHEDLHGFITAMAKKIPIDLAIISADKAMIGTGPSDGKAVDTKGLVIASTDAVAADAIGARLLGFLPQGVQYLYSLSKSQTGETDPSHMIMKGMPLQEAEKVFSMAAYGQEVVLDKDKIKGTHGN
ncbi:DUF362 domain-containing protein [Anaerocolumna sedimenticola]|uniref:DUF362 domain-containing protein n=1 Tax=Anaerocolumna sedimenticola TaxID=2696063 RepID=A0A6P1TPG9_9FIRM|nr:DUF362 domain-containing protein [Anaerocolumna sedimenticola]QHQ61696.1 DUF362 domain-containing protein [Anaerocolumna sedimenticola]